MAAAGIVLVDTMIVIEAVDTSCWNAITGQKRVVTVQECEDELRRGDPATPGYVTVTDGDIGRCEVVALSDADRAEFQLSYPDAHRLDPGERDLLASASSLQRDFKLCCCDKAAVESTTPKVPSTPPIRRAIYSNSPGPAPSPPNTPTTSPLRSKQRIRFS